MKFPAKIMKAFNGFNGQNLDFLETFYARDAVFADPVTQVRGLDEIKKYYSHTYKNVRQIQFDFGKMIEEGSAVSAEWNMRLTVHGLHGGKPYEVAGCSVFVFNNEGLVQSHRDYVDLGAMVYERIPIQGAVIRKIKSLLHG